MKCLLLNCPFPILTFSRFILLVFAILLTACAHSGLIEDKEYVQSEKLFFEGQYQDSLSAYPQEKEELGFITVFETSWISFWKDHSGAPIDMKERSLERIEQLRKLVDQIDERRIIKVQTETATFFLGESEDGYMPSEHEILILYLFLAMNYLDAQEPENARIYLRLAADFLDGDPEGKQENKFDDPAMRIWLASLWSQIGEFDFSHVNLRVADRLKPDLNIRQWLNQNENQVFTLKFIGQGPTTKWDEAGKLIGFDFQTVPYEETKVSYPTQDWYFWHQNRNTKLRDRLVQSNYMMNYLGIESGLHLRRASGLAMSAPIYIASAAVLIGGVGIIGYAAAHSGAGSGEGLAYLLTGVLYFSKTIYDFANKMNKDIKINSEKNYKEQMSRLKTYRFVRFLPAAVGLEESSESWTWQK